MLTRSDIQNALSLAEYLPVIEEAHALHAQGKVYAPDLLHADVRNGEFHLKTGGICYGNEIDSVQPTADTILKLMDGPELMHKGEWLMWFGAVCVCILNGLSILFADELFRWNLSFQIRNAEHAEPSEMQIVGRYISWTVLTIMALALFIMGLQ